MILGDLTFVFIDKLTVRDFQAINRLHNQFQNKEIDEMELSNQLAVAMIISINNETNKDQIREMILNMDNIQDYTKLNEHIGTLLNELLNEWKKKS